VRNEGIEKKVLMKFALWQPFSRFSDKTATAQVNDESRFRGSRTLKLGGSKFIDNPDSQKS
jgi:hypothetical protein